MLLKCLLFSGDKEGFQQLLKEQEGILSASATANALVIINYLQTGRGKAAESHFVSYFQNHALPFPADMTDALILYEIRRFFKIDHL